MSGETIKSSVKTVTPLWNVNAGEGYQSRILDSSFLQPGIKTLSQKCAQIEVKYENGRN